MGEESVNLTHEEVLELIKEFPLQPMGNRVIITINKEEEDGNLVLSNNVLSEEQYVVAVGPMAERFVSPGDKVLLDLEKMMVRSPLSTDVEQMSTQIKIDPIEVEDLQFAIVNDNCFKARYV
jgi:hypothetical protein